MTGVPPEPASPCTGLCMINSATSWCLGCGRTIDEIAGWGTAGPAARSAIRALLPERLAVLETGAARPGR